MTMRSDSLDCCLVIAPEFQLIDVHTPLAYYQAENQLQFFDVPEEQAKSLIDIETKHIEQTYNQDQYLADPCSWNPKSELHCVDEPHQTYTPLLNNDLKRKRSDDECLQENYCDDPSLTIENEPLDNFPIDSNEDKSPAFSCDTELQDEFDNFPIDPNVEKYTTFSCDDELEDELGLSDQQVNHQFDSDDSASKCEMDYKGKEVAMEALEVITSVVSTKAKKSCVEDGGPKVDNRGKHWALKVDEGRPPEPWKDTKIWAERRKEKEAEFEGFFKSRGASEVLPWRVRGGRATGNTQKVLYMELLMHHAAGVVELERGPAADGFFGIRRVRIPAAGRVAFDAGAIPSLASRRHAATADAKARLKALVKIWETAGFREGPPNAEGALVLDYDAATFTKQKVQQSSKPKAPPAAKRPRAA